MTTGTSASPARTGTGLRDRILDAATVRFYAQGIRATSADRIIDDVGITKVTFYRYFPTKGDLVVAYLERQAAAERDWMTGARREGEPLPSLHALATGIGAASCSPGFRGCAFINAAAEFSDPDEPVRTTVEAHRGWTRGLFASIAADLGAADVDEVAGQLMLLRDGAMVNGYLGDPDSIAQALDAAFTAVVSRATEGAAP